jgi:hypothetical protein
MEQQLIIIALLLISSSISVPTIRTTASLSTAHATVHPHDIPPPPADISMYSREQWLPEADHHESTRWRHAKDSVDGHKARGIKHTTSSGHSSSSSTSSSRVGTQEGNSRIDFGEYVMGGALLAGAVAGIGWLSTGGSVHH